MSLVEVAPVPLIAVASCIGRRHIVPFIAIPVLCPEKVADESDEAAVCAAWTGAQAPRDGGANRLRHILEGREPLLKALQSESRRFSAYLRSDVTQLPRHEQLDVRPSDPEAYTTYIGEEEWHSQLPAASSGGSGGAALVARDASASERFDAHVALVELALTDLSRAVDPRADDADDDDFGVVVRSGFGAATDAAWATSTRSLRCCCARDVFTTLRMSTKLLSDLDSRVAGASVTSVLLQKYRHIHESSEFRLFISLTREHALDRLIGSEGLSATPPGTLLGACQRRVDQCFDHLAAMTRADAVALFARFQSFTLREAAALTRQLADEPPSSGGDECIRILALDVVADESESLPILLLSAAAINLLPLPEAGASSSDANCDGSERFSDEALIEHFRLFRDARSLLRHAAHHRATPGSIADHPVFVATSQDDLCGDITAMQSHRGLPAELADPTLLANAPPEVREMLERLGEQLRAQGQQQQ